MPTSNKGKIFAFAAILFIALNLRGPFTSLAPVLGQIMESLTLSASAAGMLTALPLLTFAFFSPLAAGLSRKLGLYPSLLAALVAITSGIVLRSYGTEIPLYLGTILIGAGIATGNVLLPVVVKVNFPTRIATITSLYVFTMGIGSTLSASLMVPLSNISFAHMGGWQIALLFNLIFPVLAIAICLPLVLSHKKKTQTNKQKIQTDHNQTTITQLLRCPVAWQVTLGIGLNSFTFYSLAGWLPKILSDQGYNEIDAGYIYGLLQFSTMIPGLLLLPILSKTNNQRSLISICAFSVFVSLVGMVFSPQYALLWVSLFGLSNCATFIIAISFVGMRTANSGQAAALSGLSQCIGYGLAATGPSLIGYLHSETESWAVPVLTIAAVALLCTLFANLAARDKKVQVRPAQTSK
ncbi:2-nitroimidazole transporter [Psychromonas marina]|uniref:2-nitroimidazole transporter n=1 Tax=Psychromonas marina TaxID=88364 RepID=A0ABQ6DWK8_9GAMM|nr:MFS transporter [Psychromonas marina]GLS89526.1 2-nitroimidazole transporter [Psychromonas marina]